MPIRWKECVFPALALLWVAAYWIQLEGAPRAARVVPEGVMVFILVMVFVILLRDAVIWLGQGASAAATSATSGLPTPSVLFGLRRELAFIALSVVYYVLFDYIGFHPANVAFLAVTLRVAGNPWRTVAAGTIATGLVIYGVAEVMQFNLPAPKLFR